MDDLPTEISERFVHVRPPPRRGLVVGRLPLRRDGEGTRARYRSVFLEVGFIAYDDQGDPRVVFYSDDLFAQFVELVEAAEAGDGEDEQEPLAGFHVQLSGRMLELLCRGMDIVYLIAAVFVLTERLEGRSVRHRLTELFRASGI